MQRILILSNDSFMLWQFRRELLATMLASSMDVVVSVPFGAHVEDLQGMGCRLIDTPMGTSGPGGDRALKHRYLQILKEEKPHMVVTYGARANICGGLTCRKLHIPYCANIQASAHLFRSPVMGWLTGRMYRTALKQAKVVFFENPGSASFFARNKLTTKSQQVLLSGAGVNLTHYAPRPYPENDPIRFLYLGRAKKEKGMDELLAAIKMLYDDCYDVRLDLVGAIDEAYREPLEQLRQQELVVIHGYQDDPRPFYAAADCVVLPSHSEGMSNVLLEAAASARPVIASYIPGCREAVDEARTGFTCRVQDKYGLYETMRKMAAMPRQQRAEMGLAGRRRMEELFDKQAVVEDTMNAIFRQ